MEPSVTLLPSSDASSMPITAASSRNSWSVTLDRSTVIVEIVVLCSTQTVLPFHVAVKPPSLVSAKRSAV